MFRLAACMSLLLSACAGERDHFYTLNTLPNGAHGALASPTLHVILEVSVPLLVDRAEMIVSTPDNGILVLDHQRWAIPLSEQVSQTLARDLENRRDDVLVGDRGFDQGTPPTTIKVDIVRMTATRSGVSMQARWRIADAKSGLDEIGGNVFEVPAAEGYASIAKAYSTALGALADRLTAALRTR